MLSGSENVTEVVHISLSLSVIVHVRVNDNAEMFELALGGFQVVHGSGESSVQTIEGVTRAVEIALGIRERLAKVIELGLVLLRGSSLNLCLDHHISE